MRVYYIKVLLLAMVLLCPAITVTAQDDVEYRMEIGAGVGMTAYQGDFSGSITKNMQPAGAIVLRRILNPHMAVRFSGMYTKVKGASKDLHTVYPDLLDEEYAFNNSVVDVSATYEYNFWPYGTGKDYRGAKRLTPFVSIGLGLTYVRCANGMRDFSSAMPESSSKGVVAANFPLGVGVKYKVGARTNVSLDWQMHFCGTDYLDGVKDPYRIASSGLFKNTDCYSTLTLALTYSFSAKCSTCMKDR